MKCPVARSMWCTSTWLRLVVVDQKRDRTLVERYAVGQSKASCKIQVSSVTDWKLKAASPAQTWLKIQETEGSFSEFLWKFVGGSPIQNSWNSDKEVPAKTEESRTMSKALKQRGFRFCGPTITYAFMQAVGMVNDHTTICFRHSELKNWSQGLSFFRRWVWLKL